MPRPTIAQTNVALDALWHLLNDLGPADGLTITLQEKNRAKKAYLLAFPNETADRRPTAFDPIRITGITCDGRVNEDFVPDPEGEYIKLSFIEDGEPDDAPQMLTFCVPMLLANLFHRALGGFLYDDSPPDNSGG